MKIIRPLFIGLAAAFLLNFILYLGIINVPCDESSLPSQEEIDKIEKYSMDHFTYATPNPLQYWTRKEVNRETNPEIIRSNNEIIDYIIYMPYFYRTVVFVGIKNEKIVCYYIAALNMKELNICGRRGPISFKHDDEYWLSNDEKTTLKNLFGSLSNVEISLLKTMAEIMMISKPGDSNIKMLTRDINFMLGK